MALEAFAVIEHPPPSGRRILRSLRFSLFVFCLFAGGFFAPAAAAQPPAPPAPKPQARALRLSLKEALLLALQKNDDLRVELYNPEIAKTSVEKEKAEFDPRLETTLQRSVNIKRDATSFSLNREAEERQPLKGTTGLKKRFEPGATATLNYELEGAEPSPKTGELNTTFTSSIVLRIEQNLLRNLGVDVNTARIRVAEKGVESAGFGFTNQVLEVLSNIQNRYWDLIQAIRRIGIQQRSHALALELLEKKREEVRLGALAPIQLVEIESDVAARKTEITTAIRDRRQQEIRLRNLLGIPQDFEEGPFEILPSDALEFQERRFYPQKSAQMAIENRPDVKRARVDIESKEFEVRFARNQILPELQAFGSFGFNNVDPQKSGAYYPYDKTERRRWEAGLKFSIPLYNRAAENEFRNQSLLLRRLRAELVRAENAARRDVREAIANLRSNADLYRESVVSVQLRERRLQAEEEKLRLGLSNIRDLLDAQTEVINAELGILNALVEYSKSVVAVYKAMGIVDPRLGVEIQKVKPEVSPDQPGR